MVIPLVANDQPHPKSTLCLYASLQRTAILSNAVAGFLTVMHVAVAAADVTVWCVTSARYAA
jgi:hypothetical protein